MTLKASLVFALGGLSLSIQPANLTNGFKASYPLQVKRAKYTKICCLSHNEKTALIYLFHPLIKQNARLSNKFGLYILLSKHKNKSKEHEKVQLKFGIHQQG